MQFDVSKLDNIPKNSYLVVKKDVDNEDHIIEKNPRRAQEFMPINW